jgi:hypothetical protein
MDWPLFVKKLLLVDQRVNEHEAQLLKHAILDEGLIDREVIICLAQLKREANSVHPEFDRLLFRVLKKVVLADGEVTDAEALWLRKLIYSDRTATANEVEFLQDLRKSAKKVGVEFERLYRDCTQLSSGDFSG